MNPTLIGMSKADLLALNPKDVKWLLTTEEVLYVFHTLDGFWSFKAGNPYHAKLKSELCSNGFFFSKIVLQHENLCRMFADQLARRFMFSGLKKPDIIYGIPDGAKVLGDFVADALGVKRGTMTKLANGKLFFVDLPRPGQSALFVEDFCTRATAFREAEELLYHFEPLAEVIPFELVILNRGYLEVIDTAHAKYGISALARHQIDEFQPGPNTCKMCADGSIPIKPKVNDDNWLLLNSYVPA